MAHLDDEQLLLLAEDELSLAAAAEARAHLETCSFCRDRRDLLRAAEAALFRMGTAGHSADDAQHQRLAHRLATAAGSVRSSRTGWVAAAAALLLAVAGWQALAGNRANSGRTVTGHETRALPIRALTPGATVAVDVGDLCRQMPAEPSPIPEAVRDRVLRSYGMERVPDHEYELDYLITPDLGGSPDPRNLWPEPYHSPVWNARVKDELESLLPQLVCEGKLDLRTAQQDIAADWIAAYKKYFKTDRPLRRS